MILNKAIDAYQRVAAIMAEIEQILPSRKAEEIVLLVREMESVQEEIRDMDQDVMAAIRHGGQIHGEKIQELVSMMKQIQQTNRRLVPQVSTIMAVQKNELQKLKTGSSMMRRYHSHTPKSGRLLQSAG
ncbi:hypothetical protein [Desulfogranum japonicum]|uniref:hypothetical protein n=1 Tax=Desulfogranum japonicum TaxID=231447 RepID=UPI0004030723|nr:hypothetical protein [Desulfogranum japonicum]